MTSIDEELSTTGLAALLDSRSIAVVGASDRPGSPGSRVMHVLHSTGYSGEIFAVNPRVPSFDGATSVPTLADVRPGPLDHVLILTPAATVPDVLRECVRRGVGAVTLLSAGFEGIDDGPSTGFRDIVGDSGLRILGPNCLGVVNVHSGLVASPASAFMAGKMSPGPVSIVAQSGAVGAYLIGLLADVGIGARYFASTGNEADIRIGEILMHFARDPATESVVVYLEGLRDPATFIDALLEARRRGKSVIIIKAGETEVGMAAVRSHTAALAGDDAAYDAAFERLGAFRARSLGEAVLAVRTSLQPLRREDPIQRVAVMTTSGGLGILTAEALVLDGFTLPEVPQSTRERMLEILPFSTPSNPIDLGGTVPAEQETFLELLRLAADTLRLDALVMVVSNMPHSPTAWTGIRDTLATFATTHPVALLVVGALSSEDAAMFRGLGVITAGDPQDAVRELSVLDRVTSRRSSSGTISHPLHPPMDGELGSMSDIAAMRLLEDIGVRFPDQVAFPVATTPLPEGIDDLALPVAAKLLQDGVLHKAAAGNVVTGLNSRDELHEAIAGFQAKANGDGHVLAQSMVDDIIGEVIVSVRRDPTFGPMFVIGTGGRHVEILQDRALLFRPLEEVDVANGIAELQHLGDLGPHRQQHVQAIAKVLTALDRLLDDQPQINEVEINPIILRSSAPFAVAVDAVVLTSSPPPSPHVAETGVVKA